MDNSPTFRLIVTNIILAAMTIAATLVVAVGIFHELVRRRMVRRSVNRELEADMRRWFSNSRK
jgi:hypothetical protein